MQVGERGEKAQSRRHSLWSKEAFLADLAKLGTAKAVCEMYATPESSWQALQGDVWAWRQTDKRFDAQVAELMPGPKSPGRPRKDGGDTSWQEDYCAELVETSGNEHKARLKTPYSSRQISEFLDPNASSYDERFAIMVQDSWAEIAGLNQEAAFGGVKEATKLAEAAESGKEAFFEIKAVETKARMAAKALEKILPDKYGNRVTMGGKVEHVHQLQSRYRTKAELVANFVEERERFMEHRKESLQLPANIQTIKEEPVDVEVIEE